MFAQHPGSDLGGVFRRGQRMLTQLQWIPRGTPNTPQATAPKLSLKAVPSRAPGAALPPPATPRGRTPRSRLKVPC